MNTIKKFIHYYGPYKTVFFIDLICAAVISLIDLAYPQILRTMTKTLFTQDQSRILHALPVIAGGLFLMYVIQCLCKYYVTCQGHMMGANMERDMRQELFDHYQQLSFSYYSQNNSGQMMSKLVSDLFDISEFAHHGPENLFISLVKIIGAFVFLLGQFTRNYTQTVKRAADNKRRYAPGWVHSTCLLRGFPKGAAPHLAHDFAEQSVVCYTLCRRCPENTVAAGEGKGI